MNVRSQHTWNSRSTALGSRLRSTIGKTKGSVVQRLRPDRLAFDLRIESEPAFQQVKAQTMLPFVRAAMLYEMVANSEKATTPGDYVECGVWKGGAVGVMALANIKHGGVRRQIHLFDAFDDICEPDPSLDGSDVIDATSELVGHSNFSGRLEPVKGAYDRMGGHGTEAICRELLVDNIGYPEEKLTFHKGWFQDTVPSAVQQATIGQIAILRLDGDYYASTKVCLDHLYDRVSPGGFVVIDDYGAYEGCRKAVSDFFAERSINPFLSYTDDVCRYWVKQ